MHNNILSKLFNATSSYILRLVYIQIALAFVYIPILVYWGLPISLMSIVGNIIFAPFLMLCILCAFFIFFFELLYIPNGIWCTLFEHLTQCWTTLLLHGSPNWLIGFAHPGIFYLVLFALAGISSLAISRNWRPLLRVLLIGLVLTSGMFMLKYGTKKSHLHVITYQNKSCTVTQEGDTLCLTIDHSGLRKKNFASWFNTIIKKELYRTFGRGTVDTVKLIKPTQYTRDVIQEHKDILGYQKLIM